LKIPFIYHPDERDKKFSTTVYRKFATVPKGNVERLLNEVTRLLSNEVTECDCFQTSEPSSVTKDDVPSVLVIDDEEGIRWMVDNTLKSLMLNLLFACSSEEGKEKLEHHRIDLVICDYNMTGAPGIEVLRHLKDRNMNIPFIFYTGEIQERIPHVSYQKFSFVEKPETKKLFREVVRHLNLKVQERIES
jgi:CheY-like chemotaxis protein